MARPRKTTNVEAAPTGAPPRQDPVVCAIAGAAVSTTSLHTLFTHAPEAPHAAYVVVIRQSDGLDPASLAQELAHASGLPSEVVHDEAGLVAGRIYVTPTGFLATMDDGHIRLQPAEQPPGERGSIDSLLISLAETLGDRAVGVVLAHMGSDGLAGIAALKENGGLAVAEQDGADSAVGIADLVLPAEEILARVDAHAAQASDPSAVPDATLQAAMAAIVTLLRNRTGHDFHGYKHNTFLRRIQRRMQVRQIVGIGRYVELLRAEPDEVNDLFQDLLIGVTQFFRDPVEFERIEKDILPRLFHGKAAGDQVRLWVLGCSTGEEAYSLAMLIKEHIAHLETPPHVQIFATDIDGRALSLARSGRYPMSIAKHVSPERLTRWFTREGDTYCISKQLREMCIFSPHNVIRDAPFSRIDLISCRNLLIYLTGDLQDRVIPLFHFSLVPGGYLFLGPSENVTRHVKLFAPIDRRHRIFRRQDTASRPLPEFPLTTAGRIRVAPDRVTTVPPRLHPGIGRRAERAVEQYAPAYVLVDAHYDILHFSGRTGRFLEPAAGAANLNLFNLVHRDLRLELRAALQAAADEGKAIKLDRLQVGSGEDGRQVDLVVEPITVPDAPPTYLVLFKDGGQSSAPDAPEPVNAAALRDEHVQGVEAELRLTKERLQSTIEELESTNEELKSSNEEYQSLNEELQSANEELETSKEELQSINEELQTVNSELDRRVHELARTNSDLKNLLESTQIATLFLDNELRVKSFTPSAADIFHLVETDVGRPISHIAPRITYPEMQDDIRRVLRTLSVVEREASTPDGASRYLIRVLPYRSVENYIAGAVLTFLDVTATMRAQAEAAEAHARTVEILESITDSFYALDEDGRFTYANPNALHRWRKSSGDVLGRKMTEVFPEIKESQAWSAHLHALNRREPISLETFAPMVHEWISLSIFPTAKGLAVYMRDISERKQAEERQKLLMAELQHRVKNILAVVRSVASRTLETAVDMEDFSAHLDGRLRALARTQSVFARTGVGTIDLEELVREELLSHAVNEERDVEISGPTVNLVNRAAETFSLALHELATNAIKYGALSTPTGRVSVKWRIVNASDGPRLSLEWREVGVPVVNPNPRRIGFGRDLIERGLPYELGAATSLEFRNGGVHCVVEIPMQGNVVAAEPPEDEDDEEMAR